MPGSPLFPVANKVPCDWGDFPSQDDKETVGLSESTGDEQLLRLQGQHWC